MITEFSMPEHVQCYMKQWSIGYNYGLHDAKTRSQYVNNFANEPWGFMTGYMHGYLAGYEKTHSFIASANLASQFEFEIKNGIIVFDKYDDEGKLIERAGFRNIYGSVNQNLSKQKAVMAS